MHWGIRMENSEKGCVCVCVCQRHMCKHQAMRRPRADLCRGCKGLLLDMIVGVHPQKPFISGLSHLGTQIVARH